MGLAERFKARLEQSDIFTKNTTPQPENKSNIIQPVTDILKTQPEPKRYEFEDLEAQIIDKIRKTPYWQEYSHQKQENMISKYLSKKGTQSNPISASQKTELINNIMILSNRV